MEGTEHTMDAEKPLDPEDVLLNAAAERPNSATNYLPESDMRYLINEELGSYNEKQMKERIQERADTIPLRLDRLVHDITALKSNGYLNDIQRNWTLLTDEFRHTHWSTRYVLGRGFGSKRSNEGYVLGFTLGLALSAITGTVPHSSRATDFLSGFNAAYAIDDFYKTYKGGGKQDGYSRFDVRDEVSEVLEQYGIAPTLYMDKTIEMFNVGWSHIKEDYERSSPTDAARKYVEERLDEPFGRYSTLRSNIEQEWETIQEASVPGIQVEKVLETLWEFDFHNTTEDKYTSAKIAKAVGKGSRYKRQVSNVLNKLSEEGKNPSKSLETTYRHAEIVQWRSSQWQLTDYGRLLCYHIFEKNGTAIWIQKIAIGSNLPTEEYREPSETDEKILRNGFESFYQD